MKQTLLKVISFVAIALLLLPGCAPAAPSQEAVPAPEGGVTHVSEVVKAEAYKPNGVLPGGLACLTHPKPVGSPDSYREAGSSMSLIMLKDGSGDYVTTITITVDQYGNGLYQDMENPENNMAFPTGFFTKALPNGAELKLYLDCNGTFHEPDTADAAHEEAFE